MKYEIIVRLKLAGFHWWDGAPNEVAFLRQKHRHLFGFTVVLGTDHSDRQLEFFLVEQQVRMALDSLYGICPSGYLFQGRSCETIAAEVGTVLIAQYPTLRSVSVSEDDENEGRAILNDNR